MRAQGLPDHEEDQTAYVAACKRLRVMRGTRSSFQWRDGTLESPRSFDRMRQGAPEELIRGGRFEGFMVDPVSEHTLDREARIEFMRLFSMKGYEVHAADLWFSTYHRTGYNQGDYEDWSIRYSKGRLQLKEGSELTREEGRNIRAWFRNPL